MTEEYDNPVNERPVLLTPEEWEEEAEKQEEQDNG